MVKVHGWLPGADPQSRRVEDARTTLNVSCAEASDEVVTRPARASSWGERTRAFHHLVTMRSIRFMTSCLRGALLACIGLAACSAGDLAAPVTDSVPVSGRYVALQFDSAALTRHLNVAYGTRPNAGRQYTSQRTEAVERTQPTLTLRMDLAVPPNATATTPQPLLVLVHGGGFVAGDKSDFYPELVSYARAGFVVATINYRLTPGNGQSDTIRTTAVLHAVEDAANAIRFLRANAARYGIDPTRVATIRSSAGGGISLVLGIQPDDPRLRADLPAFSARVDGVVSTGATLQGESDAILSLLSFDRTDTPVLLFHAKETDGGTGATWSGAVLPTQQRITASGNQCTVVSQPDGTHTVELSIGTVYWPPLRDFLWKQLRLSAIAR